MVLFFVLNIKYFYKLLFFIAIYKWHKAWIVLTKKNNNVS
ncbi:hypothetical protein PTRA_a2740 [Pseudoalteromonas translucida KMM 520]|uniref:Uncharacterized protein n=1 Tax=Pseudoalteromonas translucida KMM 520 TaxID=1315283 RepID=A0A0U2LPM8_9GAMM|nr:hypothetical protein PTRA_a2740 [Pseudoalteromonas translucida KMM 520]